MFAPIIEDSVGHRYVHCIYATICMMGLASFGDVVTYTPLEDLYASVVALFSKLFMAFFYAEVSNYMSGFYSSYVEHVSKTYQILNWLRLNNLPESLSTRVTNYRNILWRKFKGIEESSLIGSMPATLGYKIKYYILEKLVQNADVIPKDEPGAIVAIVKSLSIRVYPKGEFVIMEGEIGTEMFFLVDGIVEIYNCRGVRLSRLNEGKCFGEMALLKDEAQIRMASAYCATDVSVAILHKEDFKIICDAYPLFKDKIFDIVHEREAQNILKEAATIRLPHGPSEPESKTEPAAALRSRTSSILSQPTMSRGLLRLSTIIESRVAGNLDAPTMGTEDVGPSRKKLLYTAARFVACLYNFLFLPLQMAFRIRYTAALYVIESIIMVTHLWDIAHLVMKYRSYGSKVFAEAEENEENEEDSDEQRRINEEFAVKKRRILVKAILWECLTFLPWSVILQNVYYPTYVVACVKMLRLLKFWPLVKFLRLLKTRWLNAVRILEVIFYYFVFAHIMACLMILMMYIPATLNESWVRRLPFPQVDIYGMRSGNDMTGVSDSDIYISALYVSYMTLSHVTMGDIASVNINERILTTIYVAFSLHLYVILFASITSMVTDLAKSLQATLQQKYESILASIKGHHLPDALLTRIKGYFDYLWLESKGIDTDYLDGLPDGIRSDIQLMLYKKALDNGFLFKGNHNNFDRRVAMSFFKLAKIRKCMKGDILIKAGSNCTKSILLLEGELALIGVPNSRVGMIEPGLFYSGTLADSPRQLRPAHLVATVASTIAIMRDQDLVLLMNAFPIMKNRLLLSNQILHSRCHDTLEEYIHTCENPKPPYDVLEEVWVSLRKNDRSTC
ncbi:MAG: cyclic nucleotide-binding domain-containing protein [Candidatus Pacebacteria bacterium]|nr:cyclic nucleotide-binding domain-containing protein [Candidatus Paceibacterota bacterium]